MYQLGEDVKRRRKEQKGKESQQNGDKKNGNNG